MIKTAVVILNYNGSSYLRQFLPSVIQFSHQAKIVVADNGSTDDSISVLQNFPEVEVLKLNKNLGFCGGYNTALQHIEATYYVLLNSDIEVTANWLTPLIARLDNDDRIAAVQPKILSYHQKEYFEYAGAAGGFLDVLGYPFCRGRIFDTLEKDTGQYDQAVPIFWATGACLMIRSNHYHQLGGLDEDFFAHMEEIDLCWKLNRLGYTIYCEPASRIYHVGGGTLSKLSPRKTYLNFRNGLSLVFKHWSPGEILWKLPVRMLLDWVAAIQFLMHGKTSDARMVFKAHGNFLSSIGRERKKRTALQNLPYTIAEEVNKKIFLIGQYFINNKKTFREINNPK